MRKIGFLILSTFVILTACNRPLKVEKDYNDLPRDYYKFGSIAGGNGGITLIGNKNGSNGDFPINRFLWHATLDTLNFMPFEQVSPEQGLIRTQWTNAPGEPHEQFQVTAHITGAHLFSHVLNVQVHRRVRSNGGWTNASTSKETAKKMKNAILNRARELKANRKGT